MCVTSKVPLSLSLAPNPPTLPVPHPTPFLREPPPSHPHALLSPASSRRHTWCPQFSRLSLCSPTGSSPPGLGSSGREGPGEREENRGGAAASAILSC